MRKEVYFLWGLRKAFLFSHFSIGIFPPLSISFRFQVDGFLIRLESKRDRKRNLIQRKINHKWNGAEERRKKNLIFQFD